MAYSDYKIQTFSGINDTPLAPTSTVAGNGSHLISKLNLCLDNLQTDIPAITLRLDNIDIALATVPVLGNFVFENNSTQGVIRYSGSEVLWTLNYVENNEARFSTIILRPDQISFENWDNNNCVCQFAMKISAPKYYDQNGNQLLTYAQNDLRDIDIYDFTLDDVASKVNAILAMLRTHGLMETYIPN